MKYSSLEWSSPQLAADIKAYLLENSGLPFIEAYLPQEKYTLTRQPVIENDRLYACRVLRIR